MCVYLSSNDEYIYVIFFPNIQRGNCACCCYIYVCSSSRVASGVFELRFSTIYYDIHSMFTPMQHDLRCAHTAYTVRIIYACWKCHEKTNRRRAFPTIGVFFVFITADFRAYFWMWEKRFSFVCIFHLLCVGRLWFYTCTVTFSSTLIRILYDYS